MIAYLNEVFNSPGDEVSASTLEQYKAELQVWVEQNKSRETYNFEMLRSVLNAGQNALKSAFLMNSGATIALLAFLGKLSEDHQSKIPIFADSMFDFVMGVLVLVVAYGGTYLAQNFYSLDKGWSQKTAVVTNITVIILTISSYVLFVLGALKAYSAFLDFG